MKFFFLIVAIVFSLSVVAQNSKALKKKADIEDFVKRMNSVELPFKDGELFYEIIDSSAIATKQEFVTAYKSSLAAVLKEAKRAIDVEDREGGLVVAKVDDILTINKNLAYYLKYTINFQSRDNKFRIQINNVEISRENILYYSIYKTTQITYNKIIGSTRSYDESIDWVSKLTPKQRETLVAMKKSLHTHFLTVSNGLSLMTTKNLKDIF